ncbi:MAG: DNA-deoxyinosine glycosylase, partial [Bacilli bacterium]|nr:DNA-deoxyinosine glycosylase [Bacilli bacterium]
MASKTAANAKHATHGFGPLYDAESEILILGSFPSVKSREQNFFYGHPQNRFWAILAQIYDVSPLFSLEDKRSFCFAHHIALYDSIEECDILGSSDASIKNIVPADLSPIFKACRIKKIVCNGNKAHELFVKFQNPPEGV